MLEVSPPRPPFGQVVHQRDPIRTFQIEDANAFGSETKMTISDALEVILGGSRVGREDPKEGMKYSLEVNPPWENAMLGSQPSLGNAGN